MSRLKRFAHALASGYVLLAANMFYTLASVPLALHYLPKPEFALWNLTASIAQYIALVDLGLSGAMARILIDYKDEDTGSNYGSVVQTAFLVSLAQGFLVLLASLGPIYLIQHMPGVPAELNHDFRLLMAGQSVLVAAGFITRIFQNILWAHQRMDIVNYTQAVLFPVSLGILWVGLERGWGIFSILWGQIAAWGIGAIALASGCAILKLLPKPGRWGHPSWIRFCELFAYGKDVFLFSLGALMINTSQGILISHCLGLDALAVWTVCTRTYAVICQLVWKIFDIASTPLAEMLVRGEALLCARRFRSVTLLTASSAVLTSVLFAACNQSFISFWTRGALPDFSESSFKDAPAFFAKLRQPSDELTRFLAAKLNANTSSALLQYQANEPVPENLQTNIVQNLNAIIKSEALYLPSRFAGIILRPETQNRLARIPQAGDLSRLNRLLLEDAYPDEIAKYNIKWSVWNDVLLGVWAIIMSIQRCHVGLLGAKKQLQVVKYIYFLEGALFICLTLLFTRRWGFPALIASSIIATLCCSFFYGSRRTMKDFNVSWRDLLCDWMGPAARLAVILVPIACLVWLAASKLPPLTAFITIGVVIGSIGSLLFFRIGLDYGLKMEIGGKLPHKLAKALGLAPSE